MFSGFALSFHLFLILFHFCCLLFFLALLFWSWTSWWLRRSRRWWSRFLLLWLLLRWLLRLFLWFLVLFLLLFAIVLLFISREDALGMLGRGIRRRWWLLLFFLFRGGGRFSALFWYCNRHLFGFLLLFFFLFFVSDKNAVSFDTVALIVNLYHGFMEWVGIRKMDSLSIAVKILCILLFLIFVSWWARFFLYWLRSILLVCLTLETSSSHEVAKVPHYVSYPMFTGSLICLKEETIRWFLIGLLFLGRGLQ